jgi:two-component system cell cycle response regulator
VKAQAAPIRSLVDLEKTQDTQETLQIRCLTVDVAPKVLIVDDDELVLERLRTLIAGEGYSVSTAASGEAALIALEREHANVVILDRNMPGLDGLAMCRRIRKDFDAGYVYLILLTVQDAEEDILAGLDAGADDYISKRVSTAHLVARLRTARRILSLEHSLKGMIAERGRLAMIDPLTGAHNRRYFMRQFARELKRVRRSGTPLSLLALDIDHFKQINDNSGHAAGDDVLKEFVRTIQLSLPRDTDWCARLGGEEFAVILPQTGIAGAAIVAERLRRVIENAFVQTAAGLHSVTVSIGVSGVETAADREGATVELLLSQADQCLYQSKKDGRNRVTLPVPRRIVC